MKPKMRVLKFAISQKAVQGGVQNQVVQVNRKPKLRSTPGEQS